MEMDHRYQANKGSEEPEKLSGLSEKMDVLPTGATEERYPQFPKAMVVVVDGQPEIAKRATGIWVAETFGGALVDSGQFCRALFESCKEARVEIDDALAVAEFCRLATVSTWFDHDGESVPEAQVSVNGRWFSKPELADLAEPTSQIPACSPIHQKVSETLRACQFDGRVVVVGSDIGLSAFPETPYKYLMYAATAIREGDRLKGVEIPETEQASFRGYGETHVWTWKGFSVLLFLTPRVSADEAGLCIMSEVVFRAKELGVYRSKETGT